MRGEQRSLLVGAGHHVWDLTLEEVLVLKAAQRRDPSPSRALDGQQDRDLGATPRAQGLQLGRADVGAARAGDAAGWS